MNPRDERSGYFVLCVDDEPDLLGTLRDAIEPTGFGVLTAQSGEEALRLLDERHGRVALVISDIRMPVMDGFAFCREVAARWRGVPTVLLSAYVSREDALKALENRITGFLEKPFATKDLVAVVEKESEARLRQLRDDHELLRGFVSDAGTLLDEMEGLLLELEKSPGHQDTVDRVFAIAHTVKGSSGFFKPDTVHKFTHRFEDFLSYFKKSRVPLTPRGIGVLLKGLDTIKALVAGLEGGGSGTPELESLCAIFYDPAKEPAGPPAAAATAAARPEARKSREDIRVSIDLLNELMELSGEITVIRNMINKLVRAIEAELQGHKDIAYLAELLEEMHKINSQMQDKIVDLRKVPLKGVYRPLQRAVSDLSRSLAKDLELRTEGDELRIDASLAEALGVCLIHMVRNCADHGIEPAEARRTAGKSERGRIAISARVGEDVIELRVSDDGRGIDPEAIRKKAVEKGILPSEEARRLGAAELRQLIFAPGFSTAAVVTDVSGRGVGLDMVKKTIDQAGGRVTVTSEPGKGTSFALALPVPKSVKIVASLLVRSGNDTYAIPTDHVRRLLLVTADERSASLRALGGADVLCLDGALCPLASLALLVLDPGDPAVRRAPPEGTLPILVVQGDGPRFGLIVDEILDIEDVVVKPLGSSLEGIAILQGSTFLGDGRVGLILDVDGIAGALALTGAAEEIAGAPPAVAARERSYVAVRIAGRDGFVVDSAEIVRLEELDRTAVQLSGAQPVAVYRGRLMPLVSAAGVLGLGPAGGAGGGSGSLTALVVEAGGALYGITVDGVTDLLQSAAEADESVREREGILGAIVIRERTYTLLGVAGLLRASGVSGLSLADDAHTAEQLPLG